ncbi:hypothetical protein DFH05DRAFT_1265235 [Lentinula detonsa]|uniref:Uncharacterized protein n=1 Tax=Lentinula detonsa TaxID=2804962 RepID=A0A9W8NXM9_9AGAR|nr:hypothetical protein DFH05DRAFT_1265235 [Lentinula detonsa]KAJ3982437.1 hypothetical protein F5890DRAFT_1574605 [Lentinula detonsa]
MLDAFKLKPYDLEPVYASWPDAPMFYGSLPNDGKHPKNTKDIPVDEWLRVIKEGCVERNVPKEYWHKVAQHYMGEKAKGRLDELKAVMAKVHGGNYRWNWEKFKIAMRNMGWNVDASETESIKVQGKPSGLWWMPHHSSKKDEPQCESPTEETSANPLHEAADAASEKGGNSFWITRRPTFDSLDKKEKPEKDSSESNPPQRKRPQRSATSGSTLSLQWPVRRGSKDEFEVKPNPIAVSAPRPSPQKAASDSLLTATRSMTSPIIIPGQSSDETITTVTHAPIWLLNACNALDFLSTEHPKVMSSLSAILITAGTIPSIPAISAGAGGALLASGAVQAVGAIALGVGSWLKAAHQESQARNGAGTSGQEL